MENNILNCPFCGSEAKLVEVPVFNTYSIVCFKCGADVRFFGAESNKEELIRKFNKRAEIEELNQN